MKRNCKHQKCKKLKWDSVNWGQNTLCVSYFRNFDWWILYQAEKIFLKFWHSSSFKKQNLTSVPYQTVSYKNGMSVNTIYIVGYIINDVLVSNGQFTIVNVGTN